MSKIKLSLNNTHTSDITNRPLVLLFVAIVGICLGIFFIFAQSANKPIPREEAVSYSGKFEKYETSKNYCEIYFNDGSRYDVYPHTNSREFRDAMTSLAPGTQLYILVNPNNDYVVEIKTETAELLNFELSQQAIDLYDNGYIAIGILACIAGVFLIIYIIVSTDYKRKENERHALRQAKGGNDKTSSTVMRYANAVAKSKILLKANVQGYEICYRRVKSLNELVINGRVYDEKKRIVEFAHKLYATIDGHIVEAGCDDESYSYIIFDGEMIQCKKRWI